MKAGMNGQSFWRAGECPSGLLSSGRYTVVGTAENVRESEVQDIGLDAGGKVSVIYPVRREAIVR